MFLLIEVLALSFALFYVQNNYTHYDYTLGEIMTAVVLLNISIMISVWLGLIFIGAVLYKTGIVHIHISNY